MRELISFLIFMIVLFLYIHIQDQFKKSEDLEIYEMDYTSNSALQEICNIKQPTIFELQTHIPDALYKDTLFDKNENIDIKVKDVLDYYDSSLSSVDPILLPNKSFQTLMKSDPKGRYFMEDNQDFLEETDFISEIRELDKFLKPAFTVNSKYDILVGSVNCTTPMRYHTDFRKYYIVSSGKITVKMTPYKSRKYLHPVLDFENYEFYSRTNVWTYPKDGPIRFLEFEVLSGYTLYIPPYWWFSIKFYKDTQVLNLSYQTGINLLSNLPDIARYYLQFHNTKVKMLRTLPTIESNANDSPVENPSADENIPGL